MLFLLVGLQNPGQVGSVMPSAPGLVSGMVRKIPWADVRTVVELGAGTGAITKQVLQLKRDDAQFHVFERNLEFRSFLQNRYPGISMHAEASNLTRVLAEAGTGSADVILSGIPFALLTTEEQEELLAEIYRALAPGGTFVAFQYSLLLWRRLRNRFDNVDLHFVPMNLPPAFIYRCTKRQTAAEEDD